MQERYEDNWEESMNTNNGSTFIAGMLCGVAVGAAMGLLFAPKPGANMRRDLRQSAEKLSKHARKLYDRANTTAERLADRGAEALDRASDMAEQISNRARS